jgi:hypothetical protein
MLWKSSLPLPLKDLPKEHIPVFPDTGRLKDITVTYESLENVNGISVAHFGEAIGAIQIYRGHQVNSFAYSQACQDAAWSYCPIAKSEAIKGVWLVQLSHLCSALAVSHFVSIGNTANKYF